MHDANTVKIYKHDTNMPDLQQNGDWVDLYLCKVISIIDDEGSIVTKKAIFKDKTGLTNIKLFPGDIVFIDLGITIKPPKGYETIIASRSSTYKNTGLMLANAIGIIDETYCGENDIIKAMCKCDKQVTLKQYDRLFQFRIQKKQNINIKYITKETLSKESRGGYGSTGR